MLIATLSTLIYSLPKLRFGQEHTVTEEALERNG
jgi:hypothetical protein